MNSFDKTEAVFFPMHAMLSEGFPFVSVEISIDSCYRIGKVNAHECNFTLLNLHEKIGRFFVSRAS